MLICTFLILPTLLVASADAEPSMAPLSTGDRLEAACLTEAAPMQRRWYLHVGAINVYPKLESEELLVLLNDGLRLIAPGFDDVNTVGDLRDARLLWPPQVGLGYVINEHWSFAGQIGWSAGKVRTESTDPTIFLGIPLRTDFVIRRGAAYVGLGFDYFPLGMMEQRRYSGLGDRLRGMRPFVGSSVTWTRASYDVKVQLGLGPLPNLRVKLSDHWLVTNVNAHVGVDIPLNRNGGLAINYGYNFFLEQAFDFDAWALSVEWKRFLK